MAMVLLPQPYALRIEMIRAKGFSDSELLELLKTGRAAEFTEKVDAETNWDGFIDYANQHPDKVQAAVLEGYRFSFITIGGIRSLLSIKFRKTEGTDYHFGDSYIDRLRLSAADFRLLRSLVPQHWDMKETGERVVPDSIEIRIELSQAVDWQRR